MRVSSCLVAGGCLLASLVGAVCVVRGGESVENDLGAMERLRKGKQTPFAEVEDRAKRALEEHPSGEDQGLVYYQLAHTYAQSGISVKERAEKVVEYSKKGLEYPLDPIRRLHLWEYWGDGLWCANRTQPSAELRKAVAIVYLNGLKESHKYNVPAKPPGPMPGGLLVARGPGPPTPDVEAMERKAAEIAAIQKRIRYEEQLYRRHEVLIDQLIDIYRRPPHAATELRELATEIVGDPATVETLMSRLKPFGALRDEPPEKVAFEQPGEDASGARQRLRIGLGVVVLAAGVAVFALRRSQRRRACRAPSPGAGDPSSGQAPTPTQ